jgi:hypothetical protein
MIVLGLATPVFADPRVDQAHDAVDVAAKVVDLEVQHEWETRVAWDRAVAQHHPIEAGHFAVAHAEALAALRRAEDALRFARSYLVDVERAG